MPNQTDATTGPRIYTRTGDHGETGLRGGLRVSKDHARVEALGTIDELNASLGLALSHTPPAEVRAVLEPLQSRLFDLGAEIASPDAAGRKGSEHRIDDADIARLEAAIDQASASLPPLRNFILPGGTPAAASLHVARTVCRRAERRLVALMLPAPSAGEAALATPVRFLNRLSDLLFVLARLTLQLSGAAEVTWRPQPDRAAEPTKEKSP